MRELLKLVLDEGFINIEYFTPIAYVDVENTHRMPDDGEEITHIYFRNKLLTFCIIAPHEGNHYQYLLRSNARADFDRWSVAASEYRFDKPETLAHFLLNLKGKLYEDALENLAYSYERVIEDKEFFST